MTSLKDVPSGSHVLKLGKSFQQKQDSATFHTIRYDYKPASAENTSESYMSFGEKKSVTIAVPKIDEDGEVVKDVTVFRGSQKKCQEKECLLVYDSVKGEFILEQLSSNISVKNTRKDASKQDLVEKINKLRQKKKKATEAEEEEEEESDSSDGSSSSSAESLHASEDEEEEKAERERKTSSPSAAQKTSGANLEEDLRLSESSDEG